MSRRINGNPVDFATKPHNREDILTMERWQKMEGAFGPIWVDGHWTCHVQRALPHFPRYESAGMRAVIARWHRYMPFPQSCRFPTTRAT